jgi:hypothetical protein
MGFIPDKQGATISAQGTENLEAQGQQSEQVQRGIPELVQRQAGLIAREAITPGTVGLVGGAIAGAPFRVSAPAARVGASGAFLADIGAKVYNSLVAQGDEKKKVPELSAVLEDIKNQIGLPKPETPLERIESRVVGGAAETLPLVMGGQAMAGLKGAPRAIQKIGEILGASPKTQIAGSILGSTASAAAGETGASPLEQGLVGLAGSLAPSPISRMGQVVSTAKKLGVSTLPALAAGITGATETSRNLILRMLRGGKTQEEIAKNIELYGKAGTTPTFGQAIENPLTQSIETTVGRYPGGMTTMREKGIAQQAEVGKRVEELRTQLSPVTEPVEAGKAVQKGFEKVFIPRARQTQKALYARFDKYMPENTPINPDETIREFNLIVNKLKNASPELQASISNVQLKSILNGLETTKDASGQIPFNVMRDLRSWVGEEIATVNLAPEVKDAQWLRVYGAISRDLENSAANLGPEAQAAFRKANAYTKKFHDTMDSIQSVISDKNPEDAYQAVISGARNGPTKLREVFNAVPKDAQKAVSAAYISRMGKAVAGLQDETGDVFSTSKFLQNYAKLDNASKDILFGRFGSQFRKDIDAIAQVSNKIREGSAILANPSGTAGAVVGPATISSVQGSLFAGKLGFAQGVIGLMIQANQAARLFTNPEFVNWLAKNSVKPVSNTSAAIATLNKIYKSNQDPDIKEVHDALRDKAIEQEINKK